MEDKRTTGNIIRAGKLQTFASEEDRKRLTPAAIAGVKSLSEQWDLSREEVAKLLSVSPSKWDRMKSAPTQTSLSQDQMMRVSALIGIFKGLHLLFVNDMADRWVRLKNTGPLFCNFTPIETMIEGGIPTMLRIRQYVDALRGGL